MPYLLETKVQGVAQTEKIEIDKVAVNLRVEVSLCQGTTKNLSQV
jgi:hypothetical protein